MKVNMSDFLGGKTIKYINGEPTIEEKKINGDIEVNEINGVLLETINKNVISKISDEELKDEEYLTYLLFPYITNINMDVDKDTFVNILKFPKPQFTLVFKMVIEEINNMFESAQKINEIKEDINKMADKNSALKDTLELIKLENEQKNVKSKDELIEEMMQKYFELKGNIEERDKILQEITKLQNS